MVVVVVVMMAATLGMGMELVVEQELALELELVQEQGSREIDGTRQRFARSSETTWKAYSLLVSWCE